MNGIRVKSCGRGGCEDCAGILNWSNELLALAQYRITLHPALTVQEQLLHADPVPG